MSFELNLMWYITANIFHCIHDLTVQCVLLNQHKFKVFLISVLKPKRTTQNLNNVLRIVYSHSKIFLFLILL